jgi:hypothetical protein
MSIRLASILILVCIVLSGTSVHAQRAKVTQASMEVTGYVSVETDGRVSGLEIDQRKKLPAGIAELVERTANQWIFEPFAVDGVTVPIRARMRLRLIAQEQPDGDFEVAVRNAYFGVDASYDRERPDEIASMTDRARVLQQTRIQYPRWANDRMISGTVYVRVRIDREGRVVEALAEQVNLGRPDTAANMRRARNELAAAALKGVREWTYGIPTTGDQADRPYWDGRVTIDFNFGNPSYGDWQAYVPGPIQRADWAVDDMGPYGSPDVMAASDGGFHSSGPALKLLSALQGGG